MKQLTIKLILPLTVISFASVTKWWYAKPLDAPDTMFAGYPLPFIGDGWHASMTLQIFVAELLLDFLAYCSGWLAVVFCIHRFIGKIQPHRAITKALWLLAILVIAGASIIASNDGNLFYLKRPFAIDVMETGYKFLWQRWKRPQYFKYKPAANKH